ncbi:MAG: F0F1 ATP synthase subunit B [Candidatus Falkowbacteria bacterium]
MDSLIETFHIDVKLLIAQMINFAIVFCVLYFFALKPLMKVMSDRTKKIEKSLDDAKKIEENLEKTEEKSNEIIARAKKEANAILEKTETISEEKRKEILQRTKEEIGAIINKEKEKAQAEKLKTLKEIKKEVADLVVASVEKVLEKKVDGKEDKRLIEKIVKK